MGDEAGTGGAPLLASEGGAICQAVVQSNFERSMRLFERDE